MGILVIDSAVQKEIKKLIAYAEAHPISKDSIQKTITGDRPPAGDYDAHAIILPTGYRIVYSIEEQPVGLCSHLSVSSVRTANRLPAPEVVELIMSEFGMGNSLHSSLQKYIHVWIEEDSCAVNVLTKKAQP